VAGDFLCGVSQHLDVLGIVRTVLCVHALELAHQPFHVAQWYRDIRHATSSRFFHRVVKTFQQ